MARFAEITGGRLYGPYSNASMTRRDGHPRKPFYVVVLERQVAMDAFGLMRPWLSSYRLARFAEVFAST